MEIRITEPRTAATNLQEIGHQSQRWAYEKVQDDRLLDGTFFQQNSNMLTTCQKNIICTINVRIMHFFTNLKIKKQHMMRFICNWGVAFIHAVLLGTSLNRARLGELFNESFAPGKTGSGESSYLDLSKETVVGNNSRYSPNGGLMLEVVGTNIQIFPLNGSFS